VVWRFHLQILSFKKRLEFGHYLNKKYIQNCIKSLTISIEQGANDIYWQFQAGCPCLFVAIKALFLRFDAVVPIQILPHTSSCNAVT